MGESENPQPNTITKVRMANPQVTFGMRSPAGPDVTFRAFETFDPTTPSFVSATMEAYVTDVDIFAIRQAVGDEGMPVIGDGKMVAVGFAKAVADDIDVTYMNTWGCDYEFHAEDVTYDIAWIDRGDGTFLRIAKGRIDRLELGGRPVGSIWGEPSIVSTDGDGSSVSMLAWLPDDDPMVTSEDLASDMADPPFPSLSPLIGQVVADG